MRKALRIGASFLILAMTIASCDHSTITNDDNPQSEKSKTQTVILSMAQGRYVDPYKKFQEKLYKEENIILKLEVVPDDQYYKLAQTRLAAKEVPDIMIHNAPQRYEEFNVQFSMVDLSSESWVDRLTNPTFLQDEQGRIYALPLESSVFYAAAYYNKKIFRDFGLSEPETYADFLNVLETLKIKGNGITPLYMSNKDTWTTQIFMTAGLPVLLSDKAEEIFEKVMMNQLKWSEIPEFKTILTLYQELYQRGYVNQDHIARTYEDAKEAFASEKAAILYNGEWLISDLIAEYDMNPDEIGAFVIPFGDHDIMATGDFVTGLFVPKEAKNIEGAKRVLELLSTPAYLELYFAKRPGHPGFKDVNGGDVAPVVQELEETYIKGNKFTNEMNGPISFVSIILNEALWRPYVDLASGLKTPEEIIQSWDETFTEYMKQNNQPGF